MSTVPSKPMTRKDLFEYADALLGNIFVQILVRDIRETRVIADQAVLSVKNVLTCIDAGSDFDEVPNLVHFATQYERAHERLAGLFKGLAQTLQTQGHNIDF